jgi:hypothetical protein
MRLLSSFKRRRARDTVSFDDTGVTRFTADGKVEFIAWSELQEVGVVTTDEGPFVEDVYFMLIGPENTGCVVPQCSEGSQTLVERLLQLPGFDEPLFIKAMGSTSNRKFVCWRRPAT